MSLALEERVAKLEALAAKLQQMLAGPVPTAPAKRWYELPSPPMTDADFQAHWEMDEFGKYFRKTGREAPSGWKPGDPIPDPEWWGDEPTPDGGTPS